MWFACRQMLNCIIMFSAQDQYCPYGVLQFPLGSKTTRLQFPSGSKTTSSKQILWDSKHLLRETNKPSNGAIQMQTLGKVTENLLWETIFRYNVINSHNIAFNVIQPENFVDKTCAITRNMRMFVQVVLLLLLLIKQIVE